MAGTDNSVLIALSELQELESNRVLAEQRAKEERQRVERERIEAELRAKKEAEAAANVARERFQIETEARLRIESEAKRDRSLEMLRAEIAAVQAEREAVRLELTARIAKASVPPPRGPWALAFGLASIATASLAGLLVFQQQQTIVQNHTPEPSRAIESVVPAPAFVSPIETASPATTPEPSVAAESPERTSQSPRVRRTPRIRDRQPAPVREHDLARELALDEDGDDVLSDRFLREATSRSRSPR
jgi:hypothetical protein